MSRRSKTKPNPGARTVDTHCPFCALNCGVSVVTERTTESPVTVTGQQRWKGSPLTGGAVCAKGAVAWEQVHHPDRLINPLVRRDGRLVEVGWEEALDVAAEGFLRIRAERGPAANAVLSGGSLTNEKSYLIGKLARLALGTPHIDLNGRMCMTSAGAANMAAFGADRAMTPLSEIENAEVVVVIGSNLSASFPVVIPNSIDKVRRSGGRVIVIDPRASRFVKPDDLHLALRPGTDAAVANGLLAEIARLGMIDDAFVADRTTGFAETIQAASVWTPERVADVAGIDADDLRAAALLLGTADRAMYFHARGAEQQVSGTKNVLALLNVAMARGHIGRSGCGINMLTGQRNGQGGREWGQRCDQLPAGRSIDNPDHRADIADHWGVTPESLPARGKSYVEVFQAIEEGEISGLLSISTNMAVSAPNVGRMPKRLMGLDHFVIIDPFLSSSAEYADVVLPGTTFAEEDGTITTIEGRVIAIDRVRHPVPDRGDLDIIRNLARRFGYREHFDFHTGAEVFEEMRRISAGAPIDYSGMTMDRMRRDGGIFWPCPSEDHPGTPQLYRERFAHPDGLARFHPVEPQAPPVPVDSEYPLVLNTGRVLSHYLSGNQTMRLDRLRTTSPTTFLEVHPDLAAELELVPDRMVEVTSRQGTVAVDWVLNERIRSDTVFMPYHWSVCNVLTAEDLDPTSRIPGLKYTPVSVAPAMADTAPSGGGGEAVALR